MEIYLKNKDIAEERKSHKFINLSKKKELSELFA